MTSLSPPSATADPSRRVAHVRDGAQFQPGTTAYIGRAMPGGMPGSPWHNPARLGADGSRAEVLHRYQAHLASMLLPRDESEAERRRASAVQAQFRLLQGKTLLCWCRPRACHGDVIVKALDALLQGGEAAVAISLSRPLEITPEGLPLPGTLPSGSAEPAQGALF